jgi:hypothetical protein
MNPYAQNYEVQYWIPEKTGAEGSSPMERPTSGMWTVFPGGSQRGQSRQSHAATLSIANHRPTPASLDDRVLEHRGLGPKRNP